MLGPSLPIIKANVTLSPQPSVRGIPPAPRCGDDPPHRLLPHLQLPAVSPPAIPRLQRHLSDLLVDFNLRRLSTEGLGREVNLLSTYYTLGVVQTPSHSILTRVLFSRGSNSSFRGSPSG